MVRCHLQMRPFLFDDRCDRNWSGKEARQRLVASILDAATRLAVASLQCYLEPSGRRWDCAKYQPMAIHARNLMSAQYCLRSSEASTATLYGGRLCTAGIGCFAIDCVANCNQRLTVAIPAAVFVCPTNEKEKKTKKGSDLS
ncbi:hypothetical protein M514_16820 [Trichuris suis]|uniref:Uncharacterized protein n=1 Tax=Trichuris suis TaxID=68888 RepID=A0A085NNM3_9BILA|nr:hypothetical protein M514_16820 [Trichuris suis]